MIKLQDKKKTNIEQEIYEAQVEEALAKWEAAKISSLEKGNDKATEDEDSK